MAKNKNNNFKGKASKNTTHDSSRNSSKDSVKDTHAQVPDNSPNRSGPGGEQKQSVIKKKDLSARQDFLSKRQVLFSHSLCKSS